MIGLPKARTRARTAALLVTAIVLALAASGCAASTSLTSERHTQTAAPTPTPPPTVDPLTAYARAKLRTMTLRQQVASLFMLHQPGTDGAALRSFIDRYGVGGMILMGDNVPPTPEALAAQTAAMTSDPLLPPVIAIDEEGGDVTRLPWDSAPGADVLKGQPADATQTAFAQRAALLKQAGISVNFGTVADVTADPRSFIYDRVLGTTPPDSAARVAASVAGQRGTVFPTLKHFPGHGETGADSHLTVPVTAASEDQWRAQDAPPFAAGIAAGAEFVMFGHLVYSSIDGVPASLSPAWHRILTEQLGFQGIAITDDMRMLQDTGLPEYQNPVENAVRAFAAGNTMVLFVLPADPATAGLDPDALVDGVVAAVQEGRIPVAQIEADALKLLELRRSLGPEE